MKVDSLTSLPALGALWPEQGGHFAGISRDASGAAFAVIVPPKGVGELPAAEWGGYNKDTPSAQHVTDGQANTLALLADKHEHPAAAACAAFEHEGHADWYLPSIGELRLAHMHCPELFETSDWYWSSTQGGRRGAWAQDFEHGLSFHNDKASSFRVRAFRRFVI